MLTITRSPANPIVTPGIYPWRAAATYNPAAILHNGEFYLFERAAASLRPHRCWIGLLKSSDGVRFTHVSDQPVFTPQMIGWPEGSVQDPRVCAIDGVFYMVCAVRPFAVHFGQGPVFDMREYYPAFDGTEEANYSRSYIARSTDLLHWEPVGFCTPVGWDDRDNMLFPNKIGDNFAMLRRPQYDQFASQPSAVRLSFSSDLKSWSDPVVLFAARSGMAWETKKIGASTPPILTDQGWLLLYHGVDRDTVYRVGAVLLDKDNPRRVLARTLCPIFEPIESYERLGLFIPNVVFPCGAVVKEGLLCIYYGCSDYTISLATVPLEELLGYLEICGGAE
jgi:beta-1,2-mannobiose phosphorylase / 1,2-beta-oligomannan phosphorylase